MHKGALEPGPVSIINICALERGTVTLNMEFYLASARGCVILLAYSGWTLNHFQCDVAFRISYQTSNNDSCSIGNFPFQRRYKQPGPMSEGQRKVAVGGVGSCTTDLFWWWYHLLNNFLNVFTWRCSEVRQIKKTLQLYTPNLGCAQTIFSYFLEVTVRVKVRFHQGYPSTLG